MNNMSLLEKMELVARCDSAEALKNKDKYVKRYIAGLMYDSGLTAEKVPLAQWNEAILVFGGKPEDTPGKAHDALMKLLDYKLQ